METFIQLSLPRASMLDSLKIQTESLALGKVKLADFINWIKKHIDIILTENKQKEWWC